MTVLTGQVRDANGNLMLVDGKIWFEISQEASVLAGPCGGPYDVAPGVPVVYTLTDGVIQLGATIVGNDCMTPANTYYKISVVSDQGVLVLRRRVIITGATADIGTLPTPVLPGETGIPGPQGPPGSSGTAGTLYATYPLRIDGGASGAVSTDHTLATAFNVKYAWGGGPGAVGDGVVDDTAAIQRAITAAAAVTPRGSVIFPSGIYATTGNFNLTGLSGLQILGAGIGSTIIRITHATNDLFYWLTNGSEGMNQTIGGFSVTSDTVARTAGWVLHVNTLYNNNSFAKFLRIRDIDVRKQVNGFWFAQYEFLWVNGCLLTDFVGVGGIGMKFGQLTTTDIPQGAEAYVSNCAIYGADFVGGDPLALDYAIWIEDTDAVYCSNISTGNVVTSDLLIKVSGGHATANHFFQQCIFDATKSGPAVRLGGTGTMTRVLFTGCWFASAGQLAGGSATAQGLLVDCAATGDVSITGGIFINNRGNGLAVTPTTGQSQVTVSGATFDTNGSGAVANNNHAVYVNIPAGGFVAPNITGCFEVGSNGAGIRTGVNTTQLMVLGSRWASGTAYGVAPLVDVGNA